MPLGFASPPHDGFALLASAHGYACLLTHFQRLLSMHHTLNPRATQYLSEKFGHTEAVLSKRSEGSQERVHGVPQASWYTQGEGVVSGHASGDTAVVY
jgi:hypothetical protein